MVFNHGFSGFTLIRSTSLPSTSSGQDAALRTGFWWFLVVFLGILGWFLLFFAEKWVIF